MAERENNPREEMERVIDAGGSVYHRGRIISRREDLPTDAELARGDRTASAAARRRLEAQRASIDEELATLNSTDTGAAATPERGAAPRTATPTPPDDELPDDFPGRAALAEAGLTKRSDLAGLSEDELTAVGGIGKKTAAQIVEALK